VGQEARGRRGQPDLHADPAQRRRRSAAQSYGSIGFAAPGTFVLAMVFLVAFVLYYFINWKYLSQVWGLS
jgi:cytochrome c oxidase subunit 1